jgi:hypothetical protein
VAREQSLAALARLKSAPSGGEITGKVLWDRGTLKKTIVLVTVTGTASYSAVADTNGRFRILTVPGEYRVHLTSEGWTFSPPGFSYEDPDTVKLQNGQCADIWFEAAPEQKQP